MIRIKDDDGHEAIPSLNDAGTFVAIAVNEIADAAGYDLTFSSGIDRPGLQDRVGKNATSNSWHPFGLGWDYALVARPGTVDATQATYQEIAGELETALGKLYDVIARPHGTGAHIHIEYDVKRKLA